MASRKYVYLPILMVEIDLQMRIARAGNGTDLTGGSINIYVTCAAERAQCRNIPRSLQHCLSACTELCQIPRACP